jgi:hypothetical protein
MLAWQPSGLALLDATKVGCRGSSSKAVPWLPCNHSPVHVGDVELKMM